MRPADDGPDGLPDIDVCRVVQLADTTPLQLLADYLGRFDRGPGDGRALVVTPRAVARLAAAAYRAGWTAREVSNTLEAKIRSIGEPVAATHGTGQQGGENV